MAWDMAGGAFLQVFFDRLASWELMNYGKEDKIPLNKLCTMLPLFGPLLDKQWTNTAVKDGVDELRDVIYHADDLLDEIFTEYLRSKVDSEFPSSSTTPQDRVDFNSSWFPFGEDILSKLNSHIQSITTEVREFLSWCVFGQDTEFFESKMEQIIKTLESIHVIVKDWNEPSQGFPPTASSVDPSSVFGRENDKKVLLQWLISDSKISVFSIVGRPGVGKTTLAQLVFNDPQVDCHFDVKSWVYVSDNFDSVRVTQTILESVTSSPCCTTDLDLLQRRLKMRLAEKKILIVLDNVWNENSDNWEAFIRPFGVEKHGGIRSKIIVTTRNEGVASTIRPVSNFCLEPLSNEDCWQLFSSHAFENASPTVLQNLDLIGRKIVEEKCEGLPWVAKMLGRLLRSKVEDAEWENVFKRHIWDLSKGKSNIFPSLLVSVHHLPYHVKLCFAYCAIIPKGYAFEMDELVLLWIAEGFVEQPRTNVTVEEIGDGYFHELVSRSLFQKSSGYKFFMTNLISDLAQYVAGEFCSRLEDGHQPDFSKLRHFSYIKDRFDSFAKLKAISEATYLRTFKPWSFYPIGSSYRPSEMILRDVLPKLKLLRVLCLSGYDIVELPAFIVDLIHLRLLDLSYTPIKCLPDTLIRLCNIEALLMRYCKNLTRLPEVLCKLTCLRHLDTSGTNLSEMPIQIGRLRSLQGLTTFVVGNQIGSTISELRELHHLRGTLSISNLQNVRNVRDVLEANLINKKHLEELKLEWGAGPSGHTDDSQNKILDKLQPHENLKHLTIKNYGGTSFPDWLGDRSVSSLISLRLRSCSNCSSLPPLGQVTSLQELTIEAMNSVTSQFPKLLPCLEKLEISQCQLLMIKNILNWDDNGQLVTDSVTGALPVKQHLSSLRILVIKDILELSILPLELFRLRNLEELEISDCPTLNSIQIRGGDNRSLSCVLKKLSVVNCPNLGLPSYQDTVHFEFLQNLTISSSCDSLTSFPLGFFPNLRSLRIKDCKYFASLSVLGGLQNLASLQSLDISSCPNMESFAERGLTAPNLTSISIESCEKLKALPSQMCTFLSLQSLVLISVPGIESFPLGGLPKSLISLTISHCDKLMARRMDWGLQRLPSLTLCDIHGAGDNLLDSFPEEHLFPTSLTHLEIKNCPNLKSLDPNGLQRLNSLETLLIAQCPELRSFPDDGLPISLLTLIIRDCPLLKVQCHWDKISSCIPIVELDGQIIEKPEDRS